MKKAAAALLAVFLLAGCSKTNSDLERCLNLRNQLLSAQSVFFEADITADYGDKQQKFTLACTADSGGSLQFTVQKPVSIADITGSVDGRNGLLTFDDTVLYFPLLADEQLSPVCGPWLMLKALRSGFLTAAGKDGSLTRMTVDDSFSGEALRVELWLNEAEQPMRAEALFRGRKILSLDVKNFRIE